jgi:hypothetical protein
LLVSFLLHLLLLSHSCFRTRTRHNTWIIVSDRGCVECVSSMKCSRMTTLIFIAHTLRLAGTRGSRLSVGNETKQNPKVGDKSMSEIQVARHKTNADNTCTIVDAVVRQVSSAECTLWPAVVDVMEKRKEMHET